MARSYGVLKVSVWEPNSDFRRLPPLPQWAYAMLISQPQLNNLGIVPYTPERWARFADGLDLDTLEGAIEDLEDQEFVIVDRDAGELLVRTFIKHDKVWSQPRLVTNARKLIWEVESQTIRNYLARRYPWLLDTRSRDEIQAWEETQETPSDTRISETPIERGIETPSETPLDTRITPARAWDARASHAPAGPGPGVGVVPAAEEQKTQVLDPAAAEIEPTRTSTIEGAAKRFGADRGVLEPEARQLPAELFDDVVQRVATRCTTGDVQNPAGLLIKLTRKARQEAQLRARSEIAAPSLDEEILFEARSYARGQHPWQVASELLGRKLKRLDVPDNQAIDLLEQAADAYETELAAPAATR